MKKIKIKMKKAKWHFVVNNVESTIETLKNIENIVENTINTTDGGDIKLNVFCNIRDKYPNVKFDKVEYIDDNIMLYQSVEHNIFVTVDTDTGFANAENC